MAQGYGPLAPGSVGAGPVGGRPSLNIRPVVRWAFQLARLHGLPRCQAPETSLAAMSTLSLTIRPEFFRLPSRGVDPHFGLSRAFYYHLDATGQVLLVRIRKRKRPTGYLEQRHCW
jgi:hypothetical protein